MSRTLDQIADRDQLFNKKCRWSGHTSMFKPYFADLHPDEKWSSGNRVTCVCGKAVKLRNALNGGAAYYMMPHHNI